MRAITPSDRDVRLLTPDEFARRIQARSPRKKIAAYLALLFWLGVLASKPFLKRVLDLGGAIIGMLLLSPLLLITALIIKLESPGPVFYTQIRVGKRGKPFTIYKFRSMGVTADAEREALLDQNDSSDGVLFKAKADPRITRFGKIIRRLSIDELPQLLNVVIGDMSLVGPRPALPEEVAQYDAQARKRLQTKPGLTCIWQISGRSDIPFRQQVELDVRYLSAKSVVKDLSIIFKTVPAVLSGKGAY
ncbi:MAG: sugar transferase [Pseudomonadota bacterium]